MELRRYREGDMDALARLGVAAFGGNISDWERNFDPAQNARLDLEQVHVIEEDGEIRASTTVLPLESYVEGEWRPMGGISAVMAHPAYRRRGYAGELMRAVLRDMRVRDVALSLLSPFAHAFNLGQQIAQYVSCQEPGIQPLSWVLWSRRPAAA
jgi:GNAT superfamily N-acetyltransferase